MTDDRPIIERITMIVGQMSVLGMTAFLFAFFGAIATGLVSTALYVVGGVVIMAGIYKIITDPYPSKLFETGTQRDTHEYEGVTITAVVEIECSGRKKRQKYRTVETTATTDDGTVIAHESDTELVGEKPLEYGFLGGDFDHARSTSAHVAAVADSLKDDIDNYLVSGTRDAEIQAGLEAGFDDGSHIGLEQSEGEHA